jgi:hypothetical protein
MENQITIKLQKIKNPKYIIEVPAKYFEGKFDKEKWTLFKGETHGEVPEGVAEEIKKRKSL